MVTRLDSSHPGFETRFSELLGMKREISEDVDATVRAIIADVRMRGDQAVLEYTARFDRLEIPPGEMAFSVAEIDAAMAAVPAATLEALELARGRIRSHHQRQMPSDDRYVDAVGVELGSRWTAVESVGLYVPGGTASYPSSVLMNAVPAVVAGVERIVMVVPTPDGVINPLVLAAARLAGVHEIYRIGGAQAIAALAHGTQTIAPVAKIVGPGNAFVAAAKRQVFGHVGIDMIAGPSEVLVVADAGNDPDWLAADLLAQAEHDTSAQSILITDTPELADAVCAAVERQLKTLPRGEIAGRSWEDHGAVITVRSIDDAAPLADRIAAEHLEIATANPDAFLARIRNAGAVFLGRFTPEAVGDYVGGSNHVLPTARSARFSSGLSVLDYVKRTSILRLGPDQLAAIGPAAVTLAEGEGLEAHARSVTIRMNRG
ncbi:MAG: histidinol dehydrogenase [Nitratireductor sp.]